MPTLQSTNLDTCLLRHTFIDSFDEFLFTRAHIPAKLFREEELTFTPYHFVTFFICFHMVSKIIGLSGTVLCVKIQNIVLFGGGA